LVPEATNEASNDPPAYDRTTCRSMHHWHRLHRCGTRTHQPSQEGNEDPHARTPCPSCMLHGPHAAPVLTAHHDDHRSARLSATTP
jgi:hypothetical protein